jgi:rRNA processing
MDAELWDRHSARGGPGRRGERAGSGGRGGRGGGRVRGGMRGGARGAERGGGDGGGTEAFSATRARGNQAAGDSLRRRQKAKKARVVKKHVHFKQKMRLLEEYKGGKGGVIVAEELGIPGAESDDEDSEGLARAAKRKRIFIEMEDGKCVDVVATAKRARQGKNGNEDHKASDAVGSGAKAVSDGESHSGPGSSSSSVDGGDEDDENTASERDHDEADEELNERVRTDVGQRPSTSASKSAQCTNPTTAAKHTSSALPMYVYKPFQKELAIAAQRKCEIEVREQRFAAENVAHAAKRAAAAKSRRDKGKRFRKVTSRGQPLMKHRIDALVERLQRGDSRK